MAFVADIIKPIHSIDHTPGSAVAAGDVVVQGELVGVAPAAIAASALGSLLIMGEIEVPKPTGVGTDYAVGTAVYWDAADGNAQNTADTGTNKWLGRVIKAPATTDTHMRVFMFPKGS